MFRLLRFGGCSVQGRSYLPHECPRVYLKLSWGSLGDVGDVGEPWGLLGSVG